MPSKSQAQERLMAAAAHNPKFAKKVGVPTKVAKEFNEFLSGLRNNLNESITKNDAIEMLAQHLITKPVFDAITLGISDKLSFVFTIS